MKKIFLIFLMVLLLIVGCSKKDDRYLLTGDQVIEKIENQESFLLYFVSQTCGACAKYSPIYKEVRNNYQDYLFALDVNVEDHERPESLELLLTDYVGSVAYLPTTVVVVKGEVVQAFVGPLLYSELEDILDNYQVIK